MDSIDKLTVAYAALCTALGLQYSSDSSVNKTAVQFVERRRHQRNHVCRECNYRVVGESRFRPATLHDVCQVGLSISCDQKIDVGQPLSILIETEELDLLPWMMRVTIVRDAGMTHDAVYRYGCEIKTIVNPNRCVDWIRAKLEQSGKNPLP